MAVSYRPLMHTLVERGVSKQDLRNLGISPATISKLGKDEYVALSVIDRICQILRCDVCDVVTITLDAPEDKHTESAESSQEPF